MTGLPSVRVECAFTSQPGDATQNWRDITDYASISDPISITNRGRGDQYSTVQPTSCSLSLRNDDGRFTAGYTGGAYYPNVKIGRALRVSVRGSAAGNFVTNSDFETDVSGWTVIGAAAISRSNTRAQSGSWSMKIDWSVTGATSGTATAVSGLTIGRQYTASAYVWVPAGGEVVTLIVNGMGLGTNSSVTNAWQRISVTFVATAVAHTITLSQFSVGGAYSSWMDAVQLDEGAAVTTFTTAAPPISYRFTGFVDEWPVQWAPGAFIATTSITATDRLKRLGQIGEFSNIIAEEILNDSPNAYYQLGEDESSVTAGDTSRTGQGVLSIAQVGSGGTLVFAQATGPGTDGLSAPAFTPSSLVNGKYLTGTLSNPTGFTGTCLTANFNTSAAAQQTMVRERDGYGSYVELATTAAGKLQASVVSAFSGTLATVTSSGSVNNGASRVGAVRVTISGGTVTVALYVDGVADGSTTYSGTNIPLFTNIDIGGNSAGALFTGTISHVAAYTTAPSAARLAQHTSAALTGFSGESSDARLTRYARWAGITDIDFEAGASTSIAFVDTTGKAPLAAMQEVVDTESGVLFVAGDGTLTFHARTHRYNATSAMTIPTGSYGEDLSFVPNDQLLANDVTASREGGITYRAVNAASILDNGTYRRSIELLTTSDNEVINAASWYAQHQSDPNVPKVPALSIDLLTDSNVSGATALEVGDMVTLTGLPSSAPASTWQLFLEGWTETISLSEWSITYNTSPGASNNVFVLGDATYGSLGMYPLAY